jgi:uncharacterized protein (TIGR02284 family)
MATTTTNTLNSLLRGEISATETYNQALEKFAGQPGEADLRRARDDHREAANSLRRHVHMHGGQPDTDSGWWGTWAKLVEGTAKVFGQTAALKALKEGEEHGIKEYQEALKDGDLAADCRDLIRAELLPQCQAHIQALDRLMSAQSGS